jgi:hypothetical protein
MRYPITKFLEGHGQWWYVNAVFNETAKKEHARIEHQSDSPKVNAFCGVSREKVHGPFFFTEATVTGDSFLEMLENWLLPQLNTN